MKGLFKASKGKFAKKKKASEEDAVERKPAGYHRMSSDFAALELPDNVTLEVPVKEDLMNFFVSITPTSGLWSGATYRFKFAVGDDYPHSAPKVTCETRIYHPNIDGDGAVCLNLLRKDWKPVLDTQAVIHGLIFLFLEPNPDDPLNMEAAEVLRNDRATFERKVKASLRGQTVDGVQYPSLI